MGSLSWWSCQSPVVHSCGLLNHLNSFHRWIFKLNAKLDANSSLYSLSHIEWDGHTVHMLTQWCQTPPLTITVKSSLFMNVHSSPLSLAARSHQCCINCSCYSNDVWTFFQTDHTFFLLKEYGTNKDNLQSLGNLTNFSLLRILNSNYMNTKFQCLDIDNDDRGIEVWGERIESLFVLCWMLRVSFQLLQ